MADIARPTKSIREMRFNSWQETLLFLSDLCGKLNFSDNHRGVVATESEGIAHGIFNGHFFGR